VTTYCHTDLKK